MYDLLHHVLNWVDHNRYLAMTAGLAATLLLTLAGCEPRVQSPFSAEKVTQRQLLAQAQAYEASLRAKAANAESIYQQTLHDLHAQAVAGQAHAQAALEDIQQRKAALALAIESITHVASAAAGPQFVPLISSAAGIAGVLLGLGAAADSKRKDQVILNIKSQQSSDTSSPLHTSSSSNISSPSYSSPSSNISSPPDIPAAQGPLFAQGSSFPSDTSSVSDRSSASGVVSSVPGRPSASGASSSA